MSDRSPNRSHSVIEGLPEEIRNRIEDWLVGNSAKGIPRLRYREIEAELAEMGIKVSSSAIGRHAKKVLPPPAISQAAIARAKAIAKLLIPEGAEVEQAAVALGNSLILELLSDSNLKQVETIGDLAKVLNSLGRLQSSSVMRDKWEQDKRKRIEAALNELEQRVMGELEGDPDLARRLSQHIHHAADQMMEKTA